MPSLQDLLRRRPAVQEMDPEVQARVAARLAELREFGARGAVDLDSVRDADHPDSELELDAVGGVADVIAPDEMEVGTESADDDGLRPVAIAEPALDDGFAEIEPESIAKRLGIAQPAAEHDLVDHDLVELAPAAQLDSREASPETTADSGWPRRSPVWGDDGSLTWAVDGGSESNDETTDLAPAAVATAIGAGALDGSDGLAATDLEPVVPGVTVAAPKHRAKSKRGAAKARKSSTSPAREIKIRPRVRRAIAILPRPKAEAVTIEPEAAQVEPEMSMAAVATQPDVVTIEPEASPVEPEAARVEPVAVTVEPEAAQVEPVAVTVEPEAAQVEPVAVTVEPEMSTAPVVAEPEAVTIEPELEDVAPEATTAPVADEAVDPAAPLVEVDATLSSPLIDDVAPVAAILPRLDPVTEAPRHVPAERRMPTPRLPASMDVAGASLPPATCPYCAAVLDPAPVASGRCPRCRHRIIVKRLRGRPIYLTEAAVAVFDAERVRAAKAPRWTRERDRWLALARAARIPADRIERVGRTPLSDDVVTAARVLYLSHLDRAVRDLRHERRWDEAARLRFDEATSLQRIAGNPATLPAEVVEVHRDGLASLLRGIAEVARTAELRAATCCDTCRSDDGREVRIAVELRTPTLPHAACPKGPCRCRWFLADRDRTIVTGLLRRQRRAPRRS